MKFSSITGESLNTSSAPDEALSLQQGKHSTTIDLLGSYVASFNPPPGEAGFVVNADAHGGTDITYIAPHATAT